MLLAMVPAAPPTRKNQRTTSWPGADLGEGAVAALVEVDGQRLAMRVEGFVTGHTGFGCEHGGFAAFSG